MAVTHYETSLITPKLICLEFRDPALVRPQIRAATVAEKGSGGVFQNYTIVSVSTGNPAVFTVDRAITEPNGTYIRISQSQGLYDINCTGYMTSISGSTFQLNIHNFDNFILYNGAHGGTYTANSAIMCRLATGTGSTRKYIIGRNLDKVKEMDYFPSTHIAHEPLLVLGNYSIPGKTLDFVGLEKNVCDVGLTGVTYTTDDVRHVTSLSYCIYLRATTDFANGNYTVTLPASLGGTLNITINDKVTRCKSMAVNTIGHKPGDESKLAALAQYVPQYDNYGSVIFLSEFSIPNYYLLDSGKNTVWTSSGPPVLRLGNTSNEVGGTLDSIGADPLRYGVAVQNVTPGNPTQIQANGHGIVGTQTGTVLFVQGIWLSGADNLYYQTNISLTRVDDNNLTANINTTGATAYRGGGIVTKNYSVNYAGTHSYQMDFSDFVPASSDDPYYLYIPGFGISDPIYIRDRAWAEVAAISIKGMYNQATGLAKDGRFGRTHQAGARVGVGGVTEILSTYLPHHLWNEQYQGRVRAMPAPMRFISGTAPDTVWGGNEDAGDWDRLTDGYHIAMMVEMMGPMALAPLASRYSNFNYPATKDTIGGATYPRKFLCDWIDVALWYIDMARRTQAVDGGIYSCIQFNMGSSVFSERIGRQPSWDTNTGWIAMPPTHSSTIQYAYAAAILAWHLREMGDTALSNTYLASAELAYSYTTAVEALTHEADNHPNARTAYTEQPVAMSSANPLTFTVHPIVAPPLCSSNGTQWVASDFTGGFAAMNGTTYALRQSGNSIVVYDSTNTTAVDATAFGAYTGDTGKFTPTVAAFRTIWDVTAVAQGLTPTNNKAQKAAAAGVLYNLTGTTAYKTYHDTNNSLSGSNTWGTYIYSLASGATAGTVSSFWTAMENGANGNVITYAGVTDRSFSYFFNSNVSGMQNFGRSTQPHQQFPANCILAHQKAYRDRIALGDTHAQAKANAGVKKYIKALQDAYGFLLGVNPMKMCWGNGHGPRSPVGMLNLNSEAAGLPPPQGIYPYWITLPGNYILNTIVSLNVFGYLEAPLRDWGATTSGGSPNTTLELIPHRSARPRMTHYLPFPWFVEHTENNFAKSPHLVGIALYLQYWEGSAVQADGKKRLIARAS
jgi:hypothetical protein